MFQKAGGFNIFMGGKGNVIIKKARDKDNEQAESKWERIL